jgi:cytoskeletal protein CcmA (bactofilin family)
MPDCTVKSGAIAKLGKVEGDLKVGRNATITAEPGQRAVVTGGAYFQGRATVACGFECQSMKVEGRGFGLAGNDITVRGDLIVHGTADIATSVKVEGDIRSVDIDVGGHLESNSLISKRVRVGGHLITSKLEAETVDVGGHMSALDGVELVDLRVGGHANLGGGTISGKIQVRGHLTTTKKLAYGQVQVFGHLWLPAGSTGERLSALGKVEFEGDTTCKIMEIYGAARVRGSCTAETLKVSGNMRVLGSLGVSKKMGVYGSAEVKQQLECEALAVGGRLAAESIRANSQADIAGEVETTRGLKAKSIHVGKGSRVSGPLVGEQVDVGKETDLGGDLWEHLWHSVRKMTEVEDVYGRVVRIGPHSLVKRVFGEIVEIETGAIVGELVYRNEVKMPDNYHMNKPPLKTARLPDWPL